MMHITSFCIIISIILYTEINNSLLILTFFKKELLFYKILYIYIQNFISMIFKMINWVFLLLESDFKLYRE